MRRAFALLGLSATLGVAWLWLLPTQAVATVDGPCTASIDDVDVTNGHDAPSSAVPLRSGTQVPVAGTAESRVTDLTYTVHVAGGEIQVGTVTIARNGLSWSGTVDLESISNATVGVFEVTAEVQTVSGEACSGVAYVCIEGRSPFTTAAGAGATVVGVGGGILLVMSLTRARRMGMARSSLQGFAGGATTGLGGAVLLQQFCALPPTPASAAGIPVVIGAAGAVGSSLARRSGKRGARKVTGLGAGHGGGPGAPGGQPTEVIERGAEHLQHAGHGTGAHPRTPPVAPRRSESGTRRSGRWRPRRPERSAQRSGRRPRPRPGRTDPSGSASSVRWCGGSTGPAAEGRRRHHLLELRDLERTPQPVLHELRDEARVVSADPRAGLAIVFDNFVVEDLSALDVPSG